ncbi:MAG: hypothetical protein DRK00_08860 [Thermoprotei archaeon]|nr:MAG: hypothetical protein DRK00_08860 [Thermoprotei archaeon]
MSLGREIRLSRILDPSDGRAVVVAADHGLMLGPIPGAAELEKTLRKVVRGKPDAVLLSPGQIKRLYHLFKGRTAPAVLMRADWTNAFRDRTYTLPARSIAFSQISDVKRALALGASGIVTYFFVGYDDENLESHHFELMANFARECERAGMPLIVEPLPRGPRATKTNYVDLIVMGVRLAVEAGADALKAPYTGDPDTFRRVIRAAAGTPVLILGGYRAKSLRDLLEVVEEVVSVGGSGVVFGRNVLQADDPARLLSQIRAIVHEGRKAREIVFELKRPFRIVVDYRLCTGCRICVLACSSIHYGMFDERLSAIKVLGSWPGPFKPVVCTQCGLCVKACQYGALTMSPETGGLVWNRERCTLCGACVEACPLGIVGIVGKQLVICDMCRGAPECVYWCPRDALSVKPIGDK